MYGPSLDQSGTEENLKMRRSSGSFSEIYLSDVPPTSSFLQSSDQQSVTASLSLLSRLRGPIRQTVSFFFTHSVRQCHRDVRESGWMFRQRCRQAAGRSLLQGFTFAASHSLRFVFFSWRAHNSLQPAGHSASQYLTSTSLHLHSHRRCLGSILYLYDNNRPRLEAERTEQCDLQLLRQGSERSAARSFSAG